MDLTIRVTGTNPLLMHSERLANPFDPITREMKALTSKRKKTDEDLLEIMRLEFLGSLYLDETNAPCMPTWNAKRSFVDGGKVNKLGTAVMRALTPLVESAPLEYEGPKDPEKLVATESFRDVRSVKVSTSKVSRCRPRFDEWAFQFPAYLDTAVLSADEMADVARRAGRLCGIGDFRQRFGRYEVEIW